jgi:hypothetical protein
MCGTVDPSNRSDEHVFPEAIGGTLVYREVCKRCNDQLGSSVDVALTDHFAIKGFRNRFRLAGKSGRVPVPFARGGVIIERGVRTSFTWDGEYMHRRPSVRITPNGKELLLDPRDANDIPKIEAVLRDRSHSNTVIRVAADEAMRGVIEIPYKPETRSCEPCLVKIIYELGCGLLGPSFLDEPAAEKIRAFLRHTSVNIDASGIDGMFLTGQALARMNGAREELLIGGLLRTKGRIVGYARIFNFLDATIYLSDREHPQVTEQGLAVSIDVTRRDQEPVFRTFASLGWMGAPART